MWASVFPAVRVTSSSREVSAWRRMRYIIFAPPVVLMASVTVTSFPEAARVAAWLESRRMRLRPLCGLLIIGV